MTPAAATKEHLSLGAGAILLAPQNLLRDSALLSARRITMLAAAFRRSVLSLLFAILYYACRRSIVIFINVLYLERAQQTKQTFLGLPLMLPRTPCLCVCDAPNEQRRAFARQIIRTLRALSRATNHFW
jgi:hypothetical protein